MATRGSARNVETGRREGEAVEGKRGRDGAAYQRPVACGFGRLPVIHRHDALWPMASGDVGAEYLDPCRALLGVGGAQTQRRARVKMPDLGRVNLVPVTGRARLEQEIDRGACGAVARRGVGHPCLAVEPAFGMRREVQSCDNIVGCHGSMVAVDGGKS